MEENLPQKSTEKVATPPVIHTYAGDMASMVRNNEGSVIKIAMAEQKRREEETYKKEAEKKTNTNIILIVLSITLFVAGYLSWQYINQKGKENAIHPEIATTLPTFIPADSEQIIPSDNITGKESFAKVFSEFRKTPNQAGNIKAIFFTTGDTSASKLITTKDFLTKIQSSIPNSLLKAFDPQIMIGVYGSNTTIQENHTFFIFSTSDYDHAYGGSLLWEKTLLDEFFPLFDINVSGDRSKLLNKNFEDILIENRSARVLKDESGKPLIYSMFLDRTLYIVSDSVDAINEVTKRLRTLNTKPL